MRVAVLMGGLNTERDVSLASGAVVARALRQAGHDVVELDTASPVDVTGDLARLFTREDGAQISHHVARSPPSPAELERLRMRKNGSVFAEGVLETCRAADVVFVLVYGDEGESGHAQAVLELAGIPYAGPKPASCALSFDKDLAKRLMRDAGVQTPRWHRIRASSLRADMAEMDLPPPWVVKPVCGGSTIGVALVRTFSALETAVERALGMGQGAALIESYIDGRELTVGILGGEALPVIEIRAGEPLFDYVAKYQPGAAEEICPAELSDFERDSVQRTALRVHDLFNLDTRSCSRVDFRLSGDGALFCLEINALPGMTQTSLFPLAGRAAGFSLPQLYDHIVRLALASAPDDGS